MGWSSAGGGLLRKAVLLVTQLHVVIGDRLEKDAEAAKAGLVDLEIPSDQILFLRVQECQSRPGFCARLAKPKCSGWVAVFVPAIWRVLPSQAQTSLILPAL